MRCRAAHAFRAGSAASPVSAANAPEMRTALPSGRHSPSSRLTRLTAGPIAVKSSRSAAPILPHSISPRCSATPKGKSGRPCRPRASSRLRHPGPRGGDRAQRSAHAPRGDPPTTGKIASTPSPMNLSTSPPKAWTEPAMRSNQASSAEMTADGGMAFGQGGEAAQIGKEQRCLDGLADVAPQRARQHPRSAAPAEIGLERRRQRGARGEGGERRGGEARGLAQPAGLVGRERTRPDPAEQRPVRPRPDSVFLHEPAASPASHRRPASSGGLAAPAAASPPATNPKASITSPLSARHSQVRRAISGCGTAIVRAPPASGTPSAIKCAPTLASSRSAPGVSTAASTSQESVEESCIDRSWG